MNMLGENGSDKNKTDEFTSDQELRKLLDSIILPLYRSHISDWIYYAKPNEKKGLYILSKVINSKGQQIFKTQLVKTKEEINDLSKLTLDEAYKRYQKGKNMSSYSEFYGGNLDDKYKYNNILKYKDFEHLNYAEYITKEYHPYIQAWVSIEKTEQYKEYVLDFVRSFLATIRSNRTFVTNKNEYYKNFKEKDKFTTHSPYINMNATVLQKESIPTLEELKARIGIDSSKVKPESNRDMNVYNNSIRNQEEIKKRKMELINGSKNLLKGIYNNTTSSCYQEVFKGHHSKYNHAVKIDVQTSAIKGILPDPITLNRIKKSGAIDDTLKNSIQSIMFSDNNYRKYR